MPPEELQEAAPDVDALLAEVDSPAPERAMTGEEPAAKEEPAAAPTWNGQEWEFDWNGKKVAPDSRDKAKIWMSQGYNYSQRMGELNKTHAQRMAEYETKQRAVQEQEQRFSPYLKVDEWAKKNPEQWQRMLQGFEQAQSQQPGLDPNLQQIIKPLQEKVGQFEQYFTAQQQAAAEQENVKQDQALDKEIGSIRKEYPTIDLTAVDPQSGETLEMRVLKHAQSIGTGSFKTAFRDYLHDKLIEQAKASGREAIAKDTQANAKKGILGKSPVPVKGLQPPASVRGKSYDQLTQEALAELGIS